MQWNHNKTSVSKNLSAEASPKSSGGGYSGEQGPSISKTSKSKDLNPERSPPSSYGSKPSQWNTN